MEITEFIKLNIGTIGFIFVVVFIYFLILINKRRKEKFLHRDVDKEKKP